MRNKNVYIAHCPQSNGNVAAGIPPISKLLDKQVKIGLGSDIADGTSPCIFRALSEAIFLSKLQWLNSDKTDKPVISHEVFYIATTLGGSFFGDVGCFKKGYKFYVLVIDDSSLSIEYDSFSLEERITRVIQIADDRNIVHRYISGKQTF